ncbi:hypothetical protein [Roseivirga pacifica]|nr:hypothetical protein [Roseivirga pacifica]
MLNLRIDVPERQDNTHHLPSILTSEYAGALLINLSMLNLHSLVPNAL